MVKKNSFGKNGLNVLVLSPGIRYTCPVSVLYGLSKSDVPLNVYVFNSDKNKGINYSHEPLKSFVKGIIPAPIEPVSNDETGIKKYLKELDGAIETLKIEYLIPTSERGVKIVSTNTFYRKLSLIADSNIINLLQNKYKTYDFISSNPDIKGEIGVPKSILSNFSSLIEIQDFINHQGEIFVKPAESKRGGGQEMGIVSSMGDLIRKFPDFISREYILSEKLYLPEISHTVLVMKGKIFTQSSAKSLEKIGFAASKKLETIHIPQVNKFTHSFFEELGLINPNSNIDGPYNLDFLFNQNGNLILSEVNPGRLPGGLELTINAGLNYPDFMVKLFLEEKVKLGDYKTGIIQQIF